jgi:teichuronic acid biosynthesis glycosyltransferase TuaC
VRVLVATAMYPTLERPAWGTFVRTQVESLRAAGVEVDVMALEGRHRKLLYPKGMYELRRRLAGGSIDLVHAHYGYMGVVARTQFRVPVVVTYHGDDLLGTIDENGRVVPLSRVIAFGGRLLAERVDAVIVQNAEMARRLRRNDAYVIPHEVDLELFRPIDREHARAALGLEPGKKYLLFASPPEIPIKRFPLAEAAARLLSDSDPAVELLVVHKETQDRLALYFNACDVLVFPSFQEGSPNIVKQAMACNLPIVSTDVGDVRDVIGETPGCEICAPDPAAFARCIAEILARLDRTTGRDAVLRFDPSLVAARIVDVYEHVLDGRARRPYSRSLARMPRG